MNVTLNLSEKYISLHQEQFLERARAGGNLHEEREDEYIDMFDELLRNMTDEEHNAVQSFLVAFYDGLKNK